MNNFGLIDADMLVVPYILKYEESRNIMGIMSEVEHTLLKWLRGAKIEGNNFILYFSGTRNWRKEVMPSYKSNRPPKSQNFIDLMVQAKKILNEKYECVVVNGMEADDVIGTVSTAEQNETNDIILSGDKDFYSLPATFMRVGTAKNDDTNPVPTSEEHADYCFYTQWMAGDSSDGYKGIKGIGEKKAIKLLDEVAHEDRETMIFNKFMETGAKQGLSVAEAATQCLLNCWMARILRNGEMIFGGDGKPDVQLYVPNVDKEQLQPVLDEIKGKGSKQIKDAYTPGIKASAWKVV